jgi:hypothetical protein
MRLLSGPSQLLPGKLAGLPGGDEGLDLRLGWPERACACGWRGSQLSRLVELREQLTALLKFLAEGLNELLKGAIHRSLIGRAPWP